MKKSIWKKIWEPEDSHLFGELGLIISAVLITRGLDNLLPKSITSWVYVGLGVLIAIWGAKLIRSYETDAKIGEIRLKNEANIKNHT